MKKVWTITLLVIIGLSSIAATPLHSTKVDRSLSDMLSPSGKFQRVDFADGTSQLSGLTSVVLGTNTTGITPVTQGGTGTNTATLATFTHTGTSTFPSGVWGNTGNVGIGITTPTTALHVIGTVTVSSGIIVAGSTMNVPDYVFDENYKLLPIEELKEFVEVNKHLPEFESAKNTTQLNLVQDNMRLREAIEKLTLYLFDMKQEIADLKKQRQ